MKRKRITIISILGILIVMNLSFASSFIIQDNSLNPLLFVDESTGNVGIGTSNPGYSLDIQGSSAGVFATRFDDANSGSFFTGRKADGTQALPTSVDNGDEIFNFQAAGYDGSSYQYSARIGFSVDGPVSSGVVPTSISFYTGDNSSDRVRRFHMNSIGNVAVGNLVSPQSLLHLSGGDLRIDNNYTLYFEDSAGTGIGGLKLNSDNNWELANQSILVDNSKNTNITGDLNLEGNVTLKEQIQNHNNSIRMYFEGGTLKVVG